ncbi:MAG: hypothetical protein ACR2N6_01650 [Miltoncostaeaceae bacterium]
MDETTRELVLELQRLVDERDLATVAVTAAMGAFFGGLAAALAAFAGSMWVERRREKRARQREARASGERSLERRREEAAAGKHVLLELNDLVRAVGRPSEQELRPGPIRFQRDAWLESRQTLANALSLEQLLDIDRAYSEAELVALTINEGPPGMADLAREGDEPLARTVRPKLEGAMGALQEMITDIEDGD